MAQHHPRRRLTPSARVEALRAFGPYFTNRHQTLWGDALDFEQRGVREFANLAASTGEEVPDPEALETFLRSKPEPGAPDLLYRELLALRRELPRELRTHVDEEAEILGLRSGDVTLVADFGNRRVELSR